MANLRQARRHVFIILAVLVGLDLVAAVVLLSPLASAGAARQAEFDAVRRQVQAKMKVVIPPDQVQVRVDEARKQIDTFYKERWASGTSALTTELGKMAVGSGVKLDSAHYEELDSDLPGLRRLRITANVTGDYLQEVKFINSVERSRMFFIVDNINLAEQQAGVVRLGVSLETYMKGEAE